MNLMTDGRSERDRGMERAERAETDRYKKAFEGEALRLASLMVEFTAEDVTSRIGRPTRKNVVGAMISGLAKRGYIAEVGYRQATRTVRHASRMLVWRGTELASQLPPDQKCPKCDLTLRVAVWSATMLEGRCPVHGWQIIAL